jgi:outer membrane receptor protein involved in Fe transport
VNRPEFRELAQSDIYDWIKLVYEYGNPNLKQATIHNYDIRFEYFPSANELFAVSHFRKTIADAIEQVAMYEPSRVMTWRNATSEAVCSGWEFEVRKDFGFITSYLENLSLVGNYSIITSRVEFHDATTNLSRPLQGQSPYVINGNISFREPNLGTTISVLYNSFGERMTAVGSKYGTRFINLYEEPRDLIDLSINQEIIFGTELKLTAKNLTSRDKDIFIDKAGVEESGKVLFERIHQSPTYGLQLSKTF